MGQEKISLFWYRRDLRLQDNAGLHAALSGDHPVQPIFIFDENILNDLEDKTDARVSFIHQELENIHHSLRDKGASLDVRHGDPMAIWKELTEEYVISAVYTNRDYEPYATKRDQDVKTFLESKNIAFNTFKDQVILEPGEVLKKDDTPYLVYTPFSKMWKKVVEDKDFEQFSSALNFDNWHPSSYDLPSLKFIGFEPTTIAIPANRLTDRTMEIYEAERNFPAKDSTSKLGIHLRFGTVSVREIAARARQKSEVFYSELIWREFFMMILFYYPHAVTNNFNRKYDAVPWRNNEEEFKKWCEGKTGYPMVDAGMRELNETGYMHNRVRMITAGFLTKHLLIDWRWGEAYFASKLLDYELSANNGNWQWAAGTGVDAAPYFRVFNPTEQIKKFDKDQIYLRRWVKELNTERYPEPIVEHKMARERAINTYKKALNG